MDGSFFKSLRQYDGAEQQLQIFDWILPLNNDVFWQFAILIGLQFPLSKQMSPKRGDVNFVGMTL